MEEQSITVRPKAAPGLEYAAANGQNHGLMEFCSVILAASSIACVSLRFGHFPFAERHGDFVRLLCVGAGGIAISLAATHLFLLGNVSVKVAWIPLLAAMIALAGAAGAGLPPRPQRIVCVSCLRQIATAIAAYSRQNGGLPPPNLDSLRLPFQHDADSFVCPNTGLRRTIVQPTLGLPLRDDTVLFYEVGQDGWKRNGVRADGTVDLLQEEPTR